MVRISKEDILNAAFEIIRSKGPDGLTVRDIAKYLKCSVQPIYYQFKNFESLQKELKSKIEKYFYDFLFTPLNEKISPYKQVGINYVRFARKEKNFFQAIFMTKSNSSLKNFIFKDEKDFYKLENCINTSTKLTKENIKEFHTRMWIFTHGIACLVASGTCKLSDKQISDLLSYEFQALMLLEENPNNKWININKKGEK